MEYECDAGYESLPCLDRRLTGVECIGVEKRTKPSKHQVYVLVVSWSDGVKYPVYRRYISFFDLKICLKEEFKDHPGFHDLELPALKHFERGWLFGNKETAMERRRKYINTFCQQVLQLPEEMVRSSTVTSFYETWESDFEPNSSQRRVSVPSMPTLQTLTIPERRSSGRRGSQPQVELRYQNRDIPEIAELRTTRPRSASLVTGPPAFPPDVTPRTNNCRSLPRGASLDSTDPSLLEHQYRATADYERKRPGEVSLTEGQIVEVLEKNMTGWWFVHIDVAAHRTDYALSPGGRTEQGWAPGAFLEPVIPTFIQLHASTTSDSSGDEDLVGEYETVCGYEAQNEDEISYKSGQRVQVTTPAEDGWWKVRLPDCEEEGYTAAVHLQRAKDTTHKADIAAGSTFQKRSLRGRGAPPRGRSQKGSKDAADDLPVYAQVRKVVPKDVTSRGDSLSCGEALGQQQGSTCSRPEVGDDKALNYTDVIFTPLEDIPKATDIQKVKKRDRVEYAEINPRPLPKMVGTHSKGTKGLGQEDDNPIYVNVTTSSNHTSPQIGTDKVSVPPGGGSSSSRTGTGGVQGATSTTQASTGVEAAAAHGAGASPHSESGPEAKTYPVPKPRRQVAKLPTYENTDIQKKGSGGGWNQDGIRPPAPLPVDISASAVQDDVDGGRHPMNYENHAVDFVNRFIRSNQDPQAPPPIPAHPAPSTSPPVSSSSGTGSPLTRGGAARVRNMATRDMNLGNIEQHMVQLPQAPAWPAPALPHDAAMWWSRADAPDSNMVEATQGYESDLISVLSFRKGDIGVLVTKKDSNGWLGLKIGEKSGWVPSQYFASYQPKPHTPKRKIKNIKQAEVLHENQAWFLGKISRQHAEDLLLEHGQQRDFLIRESTNRVGDLTLSVRYQDRVRHFPIQMTASGKYDIGKAHFTDLIKVVEYYQQNPIFFDEQAGNAPVALGRPINQPRTPH